MGREFELKYKAEPALQARILAEYDVPWNTVSMETAYYDTPAGDLGKLHWTLRRRYENGVSVCTVKTPSPDGGRGEWETECGDILEAIPELCKLGAPRQLLLLLGATLEEVCSARFIRQAALLKLERCTVELALDSGVLLGGGRELPLCEVEVEVKDGSEADAVTFAGEFAAKFGLLPEHRSKYRRALALAKGE